MGESQRGRQRFLDSTQDYLSSDYDPEHGGQGPKDLLLVSSEKRCHHWGRAECQVALFMGGAGAGSLDDHPGYCCKGLCSSDGQGIKDSHNCLL